MTIDKFAYCSWVAFSFFLLTNLLVWSVAVVMTVAFSFVFWTFEPLVAVFNTVLLRIFAVASFFVTIWFMTEEGVRGYKKEVENGDWLKNGKWF